MDSLKKNDDTCHILLKTIETIVSFRRGIHNWLERWNVHHARRSLPNGRYTMEISQPSGCHSCHVQRCSACSGDLGPFHLWGLTPTSGETYNTYIHTIILYIYIYIVYTSFIHNLYIQFIHNMYTHTHIIPITMLNYLQL